MYKTTIFTMKVFFLAAFAFRLGGTAETATEYHTSLNHPSFHA